MFILVPSTRQNVNSSNSGGRSSGNGNGNGSGSSSSNRLEMQHVSSRHGWYAFFIFSFILLQLMFILGPFNALRVETVMAAPAPAPRARDVTRLELLVCMFF
jgi:hypothetical protein